MNRLGLVTLVVRNYDEAIRFYVGKLGFELSEDTRISSEKRWVCVRFPGGQTGLLLAEPKNAEEASRIGNQTGGRVFLFLQTDDFDRDHRRMVDAGVTFTEEPRLEAYGKVAVFKDLYGNLFDLIEPRQPAP